MKTINISISSSSITKAIKDLRKYQKEFETKCDIFIKRIAVEILENAVKNNLRNVQYDGEALNITVETKKVANGVYAVTATGENLFFIEFGTGITYPDNHPKSSELGIVRGGYGKGNGNKTAWGYYGKPGTNGKAIREVPGKGTLIITHGNPANMPVYNAIKELMQSDSRIVQIAREVF